MSISLESAEDYDVAICGAGPVGLLLAAELAAHDIRVIVLERAPGVGGTWYWNRYPGARCDIPSLEYSFGFDPELEQEWRWTEHFAAQPEIEAYLNHVADRYDLRRDIRLETGVAAMAFDAATDTWVVDTETGERLRSRFCVMATGGLSAPHRPDWPGLDTFAGEVVQTSLWPEEGVELEQPERDGQADHPEEAADHHEQRQDRQPLRGAAGLGMGGTTEHLDELRLEAR